MTDDNAVESPELQIHIQNILYKYAKTHLATDYIAFTETVVSAFVDSLQEVSLRDQYSLVLTVDPFQTLSDLHSLSLLKPYDEMPKTTTEALRYLKKVIGSSVGKPLTDQIVHHDSYLLDPIPETFIPALTRRARKSTPKLGKKLDTRKSTKCMKELLKEHRIQALPVEPVNEPTVVTEETLNLKCRIPPDEIKEVRALLQTTTDMLRPQSTYKNVYLDPKYLYEIPTLDLKWEELFVPIFPKSRLPKSGKKNPQGNLPEPQNFGNLSTFVKGQIQVNELDNDISRENLVIVDGWETIRSSPILTPVSMDSDEEDQIDQLLLRSSPNTDPPLAEEIARSKIEPILMPRSRQVGGSSGITPHILAKHTLETFLGPLLQPNGQSIPPAYATGTEEPADTTSSLVGQPPTAIGGVEPAEALARRSLREADDLDCDLARLYDGHGLGNLIMKETLDDQPDIFMEVPMLEPPNIHRSDALYVPTGLHDLLFPAYNRDAKAKQMVIGKEIAPFHQFLKKVRGGEALGLSLSWVPFTIDEKLPSVAELIGVADIFDEHQLAGEIDQAKLRKMLGVLDLDEKNVADTRWLAFDVNTHHSYASVDSDLQILVTRRERRRLAQIEGTLGDDISSQENYDEQYPSGYDSMSPKSVRSNAVDAQVDERPAKRRRLGYAIAHDSIQDETTMFPFADAHPPAEEGPAYFSSPAVSVTDDKENWPPCLISSDSVDDIYGTYLDSLDYEVESISSYGKGSDNLDKEVTIESLSSGNTRDTTCSGASLPLECRERCAASLDEGLLSFVEDSQMHAECPNPRAVPRAFYSVQPSPDLAMELTSAPEIASRSLGITTFAQLRAKKLTEKDPTPTAIPDVSPTVTDTHVERQPPPKELFGRDAIQLPDVIDFVSSRHHYLASVEIIQKHALVRALRSDECCTDLVERQTLGGVDLILDPNTAVVFFSLFTLPARCDSYVERVAQQSWRYSNILLIFEEYPEQRAKRGWKRGQDTLDVYAYTPPIIKALKKFKRSMIIADACGSKRPTTNINYAFADNVLSGALLARMYGCAAEERDQTGGAIWGERVWLHAPFSEEEERHLAGLNGLNNFSASIILYQISLQDFVNLSPQVRIDCFAGYIGVDSMMACNDDLNARFQALTESPGAVPSDIDNIEYSGEFQT